jgi:hypothetical protein
VRPEGLGKFKKSSLLNIDTRFTIAKATRDEGALNQSPQRGMLL